MSTKTAPKKDYEGHRFVITHYFDAPRALVFQAWTQPHHLMHWWGPRGFTNPVCEWNAKAGEKIHVVMRAPGGEEYPMGGEFREVMAPERLVLTTGALDGQGKMLFELTHTVTFTEQNERTKLVIESVVTKTTPGAGQYLGGYEAGMTQSLEKLAAQVAVNPEPFVIERTFNAPVALVWKAISNNDDMKQWYFELAEFKPEVGFDFSFVVEHEGTTYDHRCRVTEAVPNKRLAYTWRYEGQPGDSLVTFELFPEGERTRLKLTHTGLHTFPRLPAYARTNFMRGWTMLIGEELKKHVEQGCGTSDREIMVSREFDAPRALVWEAWTNPKHVVNWWGPRGFTATVEQMDFHVDGVWKLVLQGPDGAKYHNRSVFKEIVPHERIVFQHGGAREHGPGTSFVATWTFDALGEKRTRLTLRLLFATPDERDFVVKEFGAVEGGQQTLAKLGEYLETMTVV